MLEGDLLKLKIERDRTANKRGRAWPYRNKEAHNSLGHTTEEWHEPLGTVQQREGANPRSYS